VNRRVRSALKGVGGVLGLGALGLGAYVALQCRAFDASMDKVYDVPVPAVVRSGDAEVLARGKHLAESVAPCATPACHGHDLAGGEPIEMGPVATLMGSNVTRSIAGYSDGELARLLHHGIKKDGRSVAFMPVQDFAWLPEDDVAAIVSYVRTLPVVDKAPPPTLIKTLGKVLDRKDKIIFDVARRIDHGAGVRAKGATPTIEYGRFLAMGCQGCHGEHFSGGPIPGAPSSMPTPLNLTPHETGLKEWSFDDFNKLLDEGLRRNGKRLDTFMPYEAFGKFDDIERRALWAFLKSLPPVPLGER
jgi:cytochrome c553